MSDGDTKSDNTAGAAHASALAVAVDAEKRWSAAVVRVADAIANGASPAALAAAKERLQQAFDAAADAWTLADETAAAYARESRAQYYDAEDKYNRFLRELKGGAR